MNPFLLRVSNVIAWFNCVFGTLTLIALLFMTVQYLSSLEIELPQEPVSSYETLWNSGISHAGKPPLELDQLQTELNSIEIMRLRCLEKFPDWKAFASQGRVRAFQSDDADVINCAMNEPFFNGQTTTFTATEVKNAWAKVYEFESLQDANEARERIREKVWRDLRLLVWAIPLYFSICIVNYVLSGSFRFLPWLKVSG